MKKLLILFLCLCASARAAIFCVTPAGAGTRSGTDWSNAMAGLPASLSRGSTYYVAGGTYAGYDFTTPNSGTLVCTIKKASDGDHVTDTGWNTSWGNATPATFTGGIGVTGPSNGYFTVDGVYEYGIELLAQDNAEAFLIWGTTAPDHNAITVRYCDMHGTHTMPHNFATDCRGVYIHPWTGVYANTTNFVVSHCKVHDVSTMFQVMQCYDMIIEYSKIYDNRVDDATYNPATMAHPNMIFLEWSYRTTFRYNEIYNTVAVGFYPAYGGNGYFIYGNYFHDIIGYAIFMYDPGTYSNARIYNNTFARCNFSPIWDQNNTTDAIANNNIFYNNNTTPNWGGYTHNFNWFPASNGEANGVVGGAANPFTTEPMISATVSSTMPRNKGQTLAAPYNFDMAGTQRGLDGGWDIGAMEVPAATVPALSTATINPAGNQLSLVFNQTMQSGAGGSGGWTLTVSGAPVALSSFSGTGSNTLIYNTARVINSGESATLTYTQPGNGIEAQTAPNTDLASITTPVSVSNTSTQGVVATPVITLAAGPYFGTQTTTITDTDTASGAVIRYTADGSTPTASSALYSAPLSIAVNQTIKAVAIWTGHVNSAVASSAYEVVSWSSAPASAWKTFTVPQQTGTFTWQFSVTAPGAGADSGIGLGPSAVSAYAGMAVIVLFQGNTIQAINGGGYTTGPAYTPGAVYKFVATINMTAKTWTLTVTPAAGGATTTIITNAAFRTGQAPSQLSWIGMFDTTGTTTLSAMSFPAGAASARYIGLRGVPASGGATP